MKANQYVEGPKRGYKYYFTHGKIEHDQETGCFIWLGATGPDGYGRIVSPFRVNPSGHKQVVNAQKHFWELYRFTTSEDISHKCHRRLCVWVHHLECIDHPQNMQLMFQEYHFGTADRELVEELHRGGMSLSGIADTIMAPRPAVLKLLNSMPHLYQSGNA